MHLGDDLKRVHSTILNFTQRNRYRRKQNGDNLLKRIILFLAFMFLLSYTVSPLNAADPEKLIYNLGEYEGLVVEIYAPYQAYPNDNMTIRIIVAARTEPLQDVTITFTMYGSQDEGDSLWLRPLRPFATPVPLDPGDVRDQHFNVSIPQSVDPGLLHAHITCSWKVWRNSTWQEQTIDDQVIDSVTYLKNRPYEVLQAAYVQLSDDHSSLENSYTNLLANHDALLTDYGSLNTTYHSLLADYSSLQASCSELRSKYEFGGEVANSLNLMYVFIEMTVIFLTTTIYFARARIYSALRKSEQQT